MHLFRAFIDFSRRFTRSPPRRLADDAGQEEAKFEIQLLALHNMAVEIAAIASAANYVASGGSLATLASCQNAFQLSNANALGINGRSTGNDLDVHSCLALLQRKAANAIGSANALLPSTAKTRLRDRVAEDTCARQWRDLSALTINAINAVEPEARWRLTGRYSENAVVLVRTLRSVCDGRWPSVDATGAVERVSLPQRRRPTRFELRQDCTVFATGRTIRAKTLDISVGGIGVASTSPFNLRDEVVVLLNSGRRLSGCVAWAREGRVGIQFWDDLAAEDPLLNGR